MPSAARSKPTSEPVPAFRLRHVPLHQVVGKIRQRIAERREFPVEHRGDLRRVGRHDHVVEPVIAVHEPRRLRRAADAPAAMRSGAPSRRSSRVSEARYCFDQRSTWRAT